MKIAGTMSVALVAAFPQGGVGFLSSTVPTRNMRSQRIMQMAGWQPKEDTKTWGRDSAGKGSRDYSRGGDSRTAPAAPPTRDYSRVTDPRSTAPARVSHPTSSSPPPPPPPLSQPVSVTPPGSAGVSSPVSSGGGGGGGGGGSGEAAAGFAAVFSKVEQALELSPMDHAEAMGLETWQVGGNSGTIAGYQGKKVDWVSRCSFKEEDGSSRECLRAWVMPMYDVPHLSISIGSGPNGLTAEMDLVAKDDVMYAKAYREQYYGGEISQWWESLVENPSVTPAKVSLDLKARSLASPVHFSVTMPDTPENAAVLGKAADELASRWIGFLEDATEIARVRRGTMLGRDSELRRLWWAVVGKDKALGNRGPEIAAGMAGPGDMGYTGQAS